jgi:hypothetical protein
MVPTKSWIEETNTGSWDFLGILPNVITPRLTKFVRPLSSLREQDLTYDTPEGYTLVLRCTFRSSEVPITDIWHPLMFQNTKDTGLISHGWEDCYSVRSYPSEYFFRHLTSPCSVPYDILCRFRYCRTDPHKGSLWYVVPRHEMRCNVIRYDLTREVWQDTLVWLGYTVTRHTLRFDVMWSDINEMWHRGDEMWDILCSSYYLRYCDCDTGVLCLQVIFDQGLLSSLIGW